MLINLLCRRYTHRIFINLNKSTEIRRNEMCSMRWEHNRNYDPTVIAIAI